MVIRPAQPDDWPTISHISRRSGYHDYINSMGPSFLSDGNVIVFQSGQRVSGFIKINQLPDGSAWLSGLRVDRDYWRLSIGSSLTEAALRMAEEMGLKYVRMIIQNNNQKSWGLATKLGFRPVDEFVFFNGSPVTAGAENIMLSHHSMPIFVSLGWQFARPVATVLSLVKILHTESNALVIKHNDNMVQIVKPSETMSFSDRGYSCMEAGTDLPEYLSGRIDHEFDRASLFELII